MAAADAADAPAKESNGGGGLNGHAEPAAATKLVVGGEHVTAFHDDAFAKLRARWQLPETFLASIDFGHMAAGGGKGGMMMGFTSDKLYIVKELNGADHATMLKIAHEYAAHVLAEEGSLLARIFGHFERHGHLYMVMNNWMPPPRYDRIEKDAKLAFDPHETVSQYDLKGCADDKTLKRMGKSVKAVHKRIFNIPLWCGRAFWSKARRTYWEGKAHAREVRFPVTKKHHADITKKVERDVSFLQHWGLMDYSLVVSFHVVPSKANALIDAVFKGSSDLGTQPYVGTKGQQTFVVYLGIIDFLQDWNIKKVIAQAIKVAERNKATIPPEPYGDRFALFCRQKFDASCDDDPEDADDEREAAADPEVAAADPEVADSS